jgi:hypothetical protein
VAGGGLEWMLADHWIVRAEYLHYRLSNANAGNLRSPRSRFEAGPAAPLTLYFLVTLLEKAFAFAILAFHFPFAGVLLHVHSNSNTDAKARITDLGGSALAGSPADFSKLIAEETEKRAKVVKFSGAKPQ